MALTLTKLSETASKITLGWTPVAGAIGYRFQSASQAPKWSHTWNAAQSQVTFSKAAWYKIEALGVEEAGEYPSVVPPNGQVIFNGDFSTGNKSQYDTEFSGRVCQPASTVNNGRITVITHDGAVGPHRPGQYFARFETRGDDYPCWNDTGSVTTTLRLTRSHPVGSDLYMGFALYVPSNFAFANNPLYNIFAEWHGDNNGIAPMQLVCQLENGQRYWSVVNWYGPAAVPTSGAQARILKLGPVAGTLDRWVPYVIRTKWSKGADGLFEGWMDGTKRFSQAGENWYQSGQSNVYLAVQYYSLPGGPVRVHYKDNVRYGDSYSSVIP